MISFALGAVGGYIVGLKSVGSGTFFALVMLLVFPPSPPQPSSSSA